MSQPVEATVLDYERSSADLSAIGRRLRLVVGWSTLLLVLAQTAAGSVLLGLRQGWIAGSINFGKKNSFELVALVGTAVVGGIAIVGSVILIASRGPAGVVLLRIAAFLIAAFHAVTFGGTLISIFGSQGLARSDLGYAMYIALSNVGSVIVPMIFFLLTLGPLGQAMRSARRG